MPEVLKTVWTMCWKRWYNCVSYAFHGFFKDEKDSKGEVPYCCKADSAAGIKQGTFRLSSEEIISSSPLDEDSIR